MSIAPSSFRRRIRRASSMEGPQSFWGRLLETISRSEVLVRLGLCLLAAFFLLVLLRGWSQPFAFRLGSVAPRAADEEPALLWLVTDGSLKEVRDDEPAAANEASEGGGPNKTSSIGEA